MSDFLSENEMAHLVEAIRLAEEHSTGEIRVHIDSNTVSENAKVALSVFEKLGMRRTLQRNGVLFHVNFEQKYLTIIGDEGIHKKVKQFFWDELHDYITYEFQKGNYFKALETAILRTGEELKKHFPHNGENPNELSNELSFS